MILFAKAPRRGTVKTRLAAGIGNTAAFQIYRLLTNRTLRMADQVRNVETVLWVSPDQFAAQGRFWPVKYHRKAQGRGDLGDRMTRALMHHTPGPAVLIGSDIPGIEPDHLRQAFALLKTHDYVFGPAVDGGFWLVGCRQPRAAHALFNHVPWSTDQTLSATLANIPTGRKVAFVQTLQDLDTADDLIVLNHTT